MNNIFGTLSVDTLPANYGDDDERSDELGAVTHHQQRSATDEYGGFFDARIFGGSGWGKSEEQAAPGATTAGAAPAAPTVQATPARPGRYPDLEQGKWVMAPGNAARVIRDGWVYAQFPDNSVTVLENEKGDELNTHYDKDSSAAKNLLITYGPFQSPKTSESSAPASKAASSGASQKGVGLGNFVAAVLPAVMQIWGPKPPPTTAAPAESSNTSTIIAVGIGAVVLLGGVVLLTRGRGSRSED